MLLFVLDTSPLAVRLVSLSVNHCKDCSIIKDPCERHLRAFGWLHGGATPNG